MAEDAMSGGADETVPAFPYRFLLALGNKTLYPDARLPEYCRKLYAAVQTHEPKGSF